MGSRGGLPWPFRARRRHSTYFPVSLLGVVVQVDNVRQDKPDTFTGETERDTRFSAGIKVASTAGLITWGAAALLGVGLIALLASAAS